MIYDLFFFAFFHLMLQNFLNNEKRQSNDWTIATMNYHKCKLHMYLCKYMCIYVDLIHLLIECRTEIVVINIYLIKQYFIFILFWWLPMQNSPNIEQDDENTVHQVWQEPSDPLCCFFISFCFWFVQCWEIHFSCLLFKLFFYWLSSNNLMDVNLISPELSCIFCVVYLNHKKTNRAFAAMAAVSRSNPELSQSSIPLRLLPNYASQWKAVL